MSKHLWWYHWWLSITLVSLSVISCTKSEKSGQHTPVGVSHRGPCRPHPLVIVTVTTLSPHHAVYLINHWFRYMLWFGPKALTIAVMHISSFPVMLIMQSDPVRCSSICLQMIVIGDWLSLCCFRATGNESLCCIIAVSQDVPVTAVTRLWKQFPSTPFRKIVR